MAELPGTNNSHLPVNAAERDQSKSHLLTIAVPALNEERNIENTVHSVFSASAAIPELRVEILIVDDGSTDRTGEIVHGLCRKFENIRMIQNPKNLGLGISMR